MPDRSGEIDLAIFKDFSSSAFVLCPMTSSASALLRLSGMVCFLKFCCCIVSEMNCLVCFMQVPFPEELLQLQCHLSPDLTWHVHIHVRQAFQTSQLLEFSQAVQDQSEDSLPILLPQKTPHVLTYTRRSRDQMLPGSSLVAKSRALKHQMLSVINSTHRAIRVQL